MIWRFGLFCWNIDTGDNPRDEVEKDEFGKDLLVDKVTAQAVEKVHGHSVLQKENGILRLKARSKYGKAVSLSFFRLWINADLVGGFFFKGR